MKIEINDHASFSEEAHKIKVLWIGMGNMRIDSILLEVDGIFYIVLSDCDELRYADCIYFLDSDGRKYPLNRVKLDSYQCLKCEKPWQVYKAFSDAIHVNGLSCDIEDAVFISLRTELHEIAGDD